jgi:hypothetical protein
MSALAPGSGRPPGARLVWVTWRQHRVGLVCVLAICWALGLAGFQALLGPQGKTIPPAGITLIVLQAIPPLVGGFLGAPLLAGKVETGADRFGRDRETGLARMVTAEALVLLGITVAVLCPIAILMQVWSGSWEPNFTVWDFWEFDVTGVVFVAWIVLAFTLGAFLGALLRRAVPAIGATVAGYFVLVTVPFREVHALLLNVGTRTAVDLPLAGIRSGQGRLGLPAIPWTSPGPLGSWIVSGWFTGPGGRQLSAAAAANVENQISSINSSDSVSSWLAQHHYGYVISYLPASRFPVVQGIEAGILLLLACAFAAAALGLVRHLG